MLKHIGVDTVGIAMYLQVISIDRSDRNANRDAARDEMRRISALRAERAPARQIARKRERETYFSMFPPGFHLFSTSVSIPSVEKSRYYRTRRWLSVYFV